jgi:hypothetical protein
LQTKPNPKPPAAAEHAETGPSPASAPQTPAADIKIVLIKSTPDGADISVNGQFIGNNSAPCAR